MPHLPRFVAAVTIAAIFSLPCAAQTPPAKPRPTPTPKPLKPKSSKPKPSGVPPKPITPVTSLSTPVPVTTKNGVYTNPDADAAWLVSSGANAVMLSEGSLTIQPGDSGDTTQYAFATRPIAVPQTGAWRVSFRLRLGELASTCTGVGLFAGDQIIGWVGADGYYRRLGTFFGKDFFDVMDNTVFALADERWHTITFANTDGETTRIECDGKTVARTKSTLRPNSVKVGEIHVLFGMGLPRLRQTGLTVSGLSVTDDK